MGGLHVFGGLWGISLNIADLPGPLSCACAWNRGFSWAKGGEFSAAKAFFWTSVSYGIWCFRVGKSFWAAGTCA